MENTLLYLDKPLLDSDIEDIADANSLPVDIVKAVIAQKQELGEVKLELYMGTIRSKVEQLSKELVFTTEVCDREEMIEAKDEAAGMILSSLTEPMADYFVVQPDGSIVINRQNPPTLEKSYEVIAQALKLNELADRVKDFSMWILGGLTYEMEEYHGNEFSITQVCETTNKAYNTVITALNVYKAFRGKRVKGLTFTHHKEIFYTNIDDEYKREILKMAARRKLNAKDVRLMGAYVRRNGTLEPLKATTSPKKLREVLKNESGEKVVYLLWDNTSWIRTNGTAKEIPTGKIVIDLKNYTVRLNNGEPKEILLLKD